MRNLDPAERIQKLNEVLSGILEQMSFSERRTKRMEDRIRENELRDQLRQQNLARKEAEQASFDKKVMDRYSRDAGEAEIKRLGLSKEQIDALPAGTDEAGELARAKALRRLAIANSYASAAKTTANFHNLPLGRDAANEILRQQGKDPLPDNATGEQVKDIFNQSRAQAKAERAAYTASQRPKTPAEQAAWLANYKEGERQHRLAKIRAFDPSAANSLERAHRADQRGKSAEQQWGNISAELDRSMDDIEDSVSQRRIDKFKQGMQREKDPTRKELEAQVRAMNLPGLGQEMTPDQQNRLDNWITGGGGGQSQGSTFRPSTSPGQSGRQSTSSSGQSQGGFEYYNRQTGRVERSSSPGVDRVFRDSSGKAYRIEGGSGKKIYT